MNSHGFEKRVTGQSLKKNFDKGLVSVHLSFIEHQDDLDVTVDVGIRLNDVENMANEGNGLLTKKEKAGTFTIGVELGNLSVGSQKRWTIQEESDIALVTKEIYSEIKTYILPFIDKYTNEKAVFNLCLKDDKEAILFCPLDYKRAINAVALAHILQEDKIFIEQIINQKQNYLLSQDEYNIAIFNRFIKDL